MSEQIAAADLAAKPQAFWQRVAAGEVDVRDTWGNRITGFVKEADDEESFVFACSNPMSPLRIYREGAHLTVTTPDTVDVGGIAFTREEIDGMPWSSVLSGAYEAIGAAQRQLDGADVIAAAKKVLSFVSFYERKHSVRDEMLRCADLKLGTTVYGYSSDILINLAFLEALVELHDAMGLEWTAEGLAARDKQFLLEGLVSDGLLSVERYAAAVKALDEDGLLVHWPDGNGFTPTTKAIRMIEPGARRGEE